MDWLEEKWDEIKAYLKNASLLRCLWGYALLTLITIVVCTRFTKSISLSWMHALMAAGAEDGFYQSAGVLAVAGDLSLGMKLLLYCYNDSVYVYFILGFWVMSRMFVEKKIKPGLASVSYSLHAMAVGDLSRELLSDSQDELGRLCGECEMLRKAMIREKKNQWNNQEEQRKINSAFAHDMRTPLTVIKGYTEFLMKYVPKGRVTEEMLLERLSIMLYQEKRLLEFSRTMSTIQEMEKRELHLEWHAFGGLLHQLKVLAGCVADSLKVEVKAEGDLNSRLLLDLDAVMEALENILSNSLRFAEKAIEVRMELKGHCLYLYVEDDGPGFSPKALREAGEFYYSETGTAASECTDKTIEQEPSHPQEHHFGMGISLAKMLCEKHGGGLKLANSVDGGAIVALELGIGRNF